MKLAKIGLALGGGGAKGLAHLGVLKHFEAINLPLFALSGTSAGAIVAALYCFKIPLDIIEAELKVLKPTKLTGMKLGELGLFENKDLIELLERHLPPDAQIEQAKLPLAIHCTDILTGNPVILTRGPVLKAVLASTCVPGLYIPQEWNSLLLVDGALTENVPLSALQTLGVNISIAVNLNGQITYEHPEGVIDILGNALDIAIDAQTRTQLKNADVCLNLDLSSYSRTNTKDADVLIAQGKNLAEKEIPSLSALLFWNRIKKFWLTIKNISPLKWPSFKGISKSR